MNTFTTLATALAATIAPACAMAQTIETGADSSSYAVTGNIALASDYMFRGLTQTWGGPAVQGGADLTMKNGFAAGEPRCERQVKAYNNCAATRLERTGKRRAATPRMVIARPNQNSRCETARMRP